MKLTSEEIDVLTLAIAKYLIVEIDTVYAGDDGSLDVVTSEVDSILADYGKIAMLPMMKRVFDAMISDMDN